MVTFCGKIYQMTSSIGIAYMGNLLNFFQALLILVSISACNSGPRPSGPDDPGSLAPLHVSTITNVGASAVLNTGNSSECANYLKGKTFIGENFRLKFDHDGNVSAYGHDGKLVFGGTLELGDTVSEVSRWINVRDISSNGKLQFLLSNDGKMMEPKSLTIYRPE